MTDDSEYRRTLVEWARTLLPDHIVPQAVTQVSLGFAPGFHGSDVTPPEDPEFSVTVHYLSGDGVPDRHHLFLDPEHGTVRMSALLRDLFAIAEQEPQP